MGSSGSNEYLLMSEHPNYKFEVPQKDETTIHYVLRCVAHLISPPQEFGESQEIKCSEVSNQILNLESQIKRAIENFEVKERV